MKDRVRWLTAAEKAACPGIAAVDVAILSEGVWYYGDSMPSEEDPSGMLDAQFILDEDWDYIPVPILDERTARLFACDCAERVLALLERERPGDTRARVSIETARRFANGEATGDELVDAWYAARDASWYAAWDADGMIATRAAYWDAAWDAVWAAAGAAEDAAEAAEDAAEAAAKAAYLDGGAADRAAERDWQVTRLRQYLIGEVTR